MREGSLGSGRRRPVGLTLSDEEVAELERCYGPRAVYDTD